MSLTQKTILSAAVACLMSACGGGGSGTEDSTDTSTPTTLPSTTSGKVIDGYVRGATVFCDVNANGALDAGEMSAQTGAGGVFTLARACTSGLVAFGGTDEATGYAFDGHFTMQPGGRMMSIMTTLLAAGVPQAKLLALLGLPAGTDLAQVDMADGQNFQVLKAAAVLHLMVTDLIKMVQASGGTDPIDTAALYARLASDLARTLAVAAADTRIVNAQGGLDATLLKAFAGSQADIQALGLSIEALTDALETLSQNLSDLLDATEDEFDDLQTELQDPEKLPDLNATTSFVTLGEKGLAVNGRRASLAEFADGVSANGLTSLGFDLKPVGSPKNDVTVRIAIAFTEDGGKGRQLTLLLDGVRLRFDGGGLKKLSFDSGAKLTLYGLASNGVEVNLTLDDLDLSTIRADGGVVTLDYDSMVRKAMANAGNTSSYTAASGFLGLKGRFQTTVAIAPLNLRTPEGAALARQTVAVPYTRQSVTGAGFSGLLTVR